MIRQSGPDDLNAAQSARARQRQGHGRPRPQTVHNGDLVWFHYTAHQWMRGRVVSFGRAGIRIEVMGGELPRVVPVRWEDAYWHQRRDH